MNRWLHSIRLGAMALTLAGLLTNCGGGSGGGDGGGGLRLFFGMTGKGACTSVVVEVDLAAASAILARNGAAVDCAIDTLLASNGCNASFSETNGGDTLRATISGCTIPETSKLFSCGFTDADISDLNANVSAQCACAAPGCDPTPPICISINPSPAACESCVDGVDNDGDGLEDCDDPNCEHSPDCVSDTTSTTTPSSSTSTTVPPLPLLINFALSSSSGPVGSLKLTVNYASAPGQFIGEAEAVSCVKRVNGSTLVANDKDSIRRIVFEMSGLGGVEAPRDLVTCEFDPDTPVPVPHNFTIVVNQALSPGGGPVHVDFEVEVIQQ